MGSRSKVVCGLSIAVIVITGLALFGNPMALIGGFDSSASANTLPDVLADMLGRFCDYGVMAIDVVVAIESGDDNPANGIGILAIVLGAPLMMLELLRLAAVIMTFVAGIACICFAGRPGKGSPLFGWGVAGACFSCINGNVACAALFIIVCVLARRGGQPAAASAAKGSDDPQHR